MTPVRQKRVRTLLRQHPEGMTAYEIAGITGMHVANVRTTLRALPDVYVDRWRAGKRGQFEKVWVAVSVPEDCPHPRDRVKWGVNTYKPRTHWVGLSSSTHA
jgi:predicted transcriptional regulator